MDPLLLPPYAPPADAPVRRDDTHPRQPLSGISYRAHLLLYREVLLLYHNLLEMYRALPLRYGSLDPSLHVLDAVEITDPYMIVRLEGITSQMEQSRRRIHTALVFTRELLSVLDLSVGLVPPVATTHLAREQDRLLLRTTVGQPGCTPPPIRMEPSQPSTTAVVPTTRSRSRSRSMSRST